MMMPLIKSLIFGKRFGVSTDGWNHPSYYLPIVQKEASVHGIDPKLLAALILHESAGGQCLAARFEKGFYDRYIAFKSKESLGGYWPLYSNKSTQGDALERSSRATSYGHCQLMGQVARELGFKGEYLHELCDPNVNIGLGALKLSRCLIKAKRDVKKALLLYNGGSDPSYPTKVLAHMDASTLKELL